MAQEMSPEHPDYLKESGIPPGWELRWSKRENRLYYYYSEDGAPWKSSWEPPAGTDMARHIAYFSQQVPASHLLVKHNGSRRASSWRQENITRTKEEAREILERYRTTIVDEKKITLPELAKTESDCSSARKGGDLGWFKFGAMQLPFWLAAVKLDPRQVSDVVETESGLHLIQRVTEAKADPTTPSDPPA